MPVTHLERLRERLAHADALLPLALVGTVSGIVTAGVIIAFRTLTESAVTGLTGSPERFESLAWPLRVALPAFGGLMIGLLFQRASLGSRQVGVVHVMERLAFHSGRLPWRNAVLQFFGGALSIASGHSVGREGPVIHVGAASSSLLGQWMGLPNNSVRVLVACGVAASIAASFNTPIAGVIFAMEVVMMEYTIVGFTPVILAAVGATSLSRLVYGAQAAFVVPAIKMASLWELPYILLVGITLGAVAAAFVWSVNLIDVKMRHVALWVRTLLAGTVTGLCALAAPQVMGVGYDTVELTLVGHLALDTLVMIAVLKLVSTTACVSLGLPGGLIGPTLVMGAAAGGALGVVGAALAPAYSSHSGLYALLGMGATMGATLQAPLAALMAILELTQNTNSILPGMFAIVTASLTSRVIFGQESVFITMLRARGREYRPDPVAASLSRIGVGAVMSRGFQVVARHLDAAESARLRESPAAWVLVTDGAKISAALRREWVPLAGEGDDDRVDLADGATRRADFTTVGLQATLQEAIARMDEEGVDVVLVARGETPLRGGVYGVLTRDRIEASVRHGR